MNKPVIFVSEIVKILSATLGTQSYEKAVYKLKSRIGNFSIDPEGLLKFKYNYIGFGIENLKESLMNLSTVQTGKRDYIFQHESVDGKVNISINIDVPSTMKYKISIDLPDRTIAINENYTDCNGNNEFSNKELMILAAIGADKITDLINSWVPEEDKHQSMVCAAEKNFGFFSIKGVINSTSNGKIVVRKPKILGKTGMKESTKMQIMLYMYLYGVDSCIYQEITKTGLALEQEIAYDEVYTKDLIVRTGQFLLNLN